MKIKKVIGNKLKNIRLKYNYTLQDLSGKSGVSPNMISRVERGLTIPSVEILLKLAQSLNKSIDYFVEEVSTTHEVVHSRAGERANTVYENERYMLTESFTSGLRDPQFTSFICTVKAKSSSGEQKMFHPGDELIYVLEGSLNVSIGHEHHELLVGDSLTFKSHLPHRWTNDSDTDSKVIWTLSPFTTI